MHISSENLEKENVYPRRDLADFIGKSCCLIVIEIMEELKLDYYFKEMEGFRFKEIFEGCTYPWEALAKVNEYLKENIVDKDVKVNKAQVGEFVSITGNYFIDEGTKINANVVIQGPVMIGKNVEIQSGKSTKKELQLELQMLL